MSETFFNSGQKSANAIREFLNGKDGVDIGGQNISFANLFSTAQSNEFTLPSGNFTSPHGLSEFSGANYTNLIENFLINNLTPSALMHREYNPALGVSWGDDGYDDGALIDINSAGEDFDYYLFRLKDEDGTLIQNWTSGSRFKIQRNFNFNPVFNGITYHTYFLLYGLSSYSFNGSPKGSGYYYWQPVTKNGVLLNHFIEENGPSNMSKVNSSVGSSGGTNGVKIWDTVRDIHANPSNYHIANSSSNPTTDSSIPTHPVNRITSDYETHTLNKYWFSIPRGGGETSNSWNGSTDLDFGIGTSFKADSSPNSSTSSESGGTWTYTVPYGVTQIEISGVGGGGGSWAAHDGGYGQNARPGGVGSGFKATLNVVAGDVFSGNIGNAGGAGYYNGGIGGPGSATTLKKGSTLIVTANPGSNGSGAANGANGTSVRASGWNTHATSIQLYTGSTGTLLSGGDGSCPACGYDPWGYVAHVNYTSSNIGTVALSPPGSSERNFKFTVRAVKGGDVDFYGNAELTAASQALGYTMPIIKESAEMDISISARGTAASIGGLAQVTGWISILTLS
jgi:hypothetical protein